MSRRPMTLLLAALVALAGTFLTPNLDGRDSARVGAPTAVEHLATPPRLGRHDARLPAPELAVVSAVFHVEPPPARNSASVDRSSAPPLLLLAPRRSARGPPAVV